MWLVKGFSKGVHFAVLITRRRLFFVPKTDAQPLVSGYCPGVTPLDMNASVYFSTPSHLLSKSSLALSHNVENWILLLPLHFLMAGEFPWDARLEPTTKNMAEVEPLGRVNTNLHGRQLIWPMHIIKYWEAHVWNNRAFPSKWYNSNAIGQ